MCSLEPTETTLPSDLTGEEHPNFPLECTLAKKKKKKKERKKERKKEKKEALCLIA
jgi:hypothetical protein